MAEPIDQSGSATGASDQPSGTATTPDLEALVAKVVESVSGSIDKRFQGFQSNIDKKFGELSQTVDRFKVALPPEEQAQLDLAAEKNELEQLRRRNQILEARSDSPREVDFFIEVMDADTFEGQLAVIRKHFGDKAADKVEQAASADSETPEVPEVDRNNPPRPKAAGASLAGYGEMTDEIAEAILKQGGRGALVAR